MSTTNYPNGVSSYGIPLPGGFISGTGDVYFVDPTNGSDGNTGGSPSQAVKTLSQAVNNATDDNGDIIYILGNASVSESSITIDKDYITVIGVAAPTMNSRAKISSSSGTSPFVTISGSNCAFYNLRIGTFEDVNVCVTVTGSRNYFNNVTIQGMGIAAAGDDTAGRSLVLSGAEECRFVDCTIGLDTIARSTTNAELELKSSATRNEFFNCRFLSFADNAGHKFIKADDAAAACDRYHLFQDCTFINSIDSTATQMDEAIVAHASLGGHLIIKNSTLVGADDWDDADTGKVMIDGAAPTAGTSGLAVDTTV